MQVDFLIPGERLKVFSAKRIDKVLSRDGILRERREHACGRNLADWEGFVEVPVNLLVKLKKCGKNIPND